MALLVDTESSLVIFERCSVVTQSLHGEPQRVVSFHIIRVQPDRFLKLFPRPVEVILNGIDFAQIIVNLRQAWVQAQGLFKFPRSQVVSSDHGQALSKKLVCLGVVDIQLKRFRQGLDGVCNPVLSKLHITQEVVSFPGPGMCRYIAAQQRINFLEVFLEDQVFEVRNLLRVIVNALNITLNLRWRISSVSGRHWHCPDRNNASAGFLQGRAGRNHSPSVIWESEY